MNHVDRLVGRITALTWRTNPDATIARVQLMREHLRRSALWVREYGAGEWPFPDIAALVDPAVRASDDVLAEALGNAPRYNAFTRLGVQNALHFAALCDSGAVLSDLPDPYEPLVAMFERGGAFGTEGGGRIEVDLCMIPRRDVEYWASQPVAIEEEH